MGTESFPGVKCCRGVLLTTHPLLVLRSWKSRAIPLPPPPSGSHRACNGITLPLYLYFPQFTPTALSVSESPFGRKLILISFISCLSVNGIVVIISVYTLRFKGSFVFLIVFYSFYVKGNSVCLSNEEKRGEILQHCLDLFCPIKS